MRTLALLGSSTVASLKSHPSPFPPRAMPFVSEEQGICGHANAIGEERRKEGQILKFIGQSEIVSPEAKVLVRAPENEEALMVTEIDPHAARDKSLNAMNNIFEDRRPEMYVNCRKEK